MAIVAVLAKKEPQKQRTRGTGLAPPARVFCWEDNALAAKRRRLG